jgi:hypothetical protein
MFPEEIGENFARRTTVQAGHVKGASDLGDAWHTLEEYL